MSSKDNFLYRKEKCSDCVGYFIYSPVQENTNGPCFF